MSPNVITRNWRDLIRPRGITIEQETLTEFYGKFTCEPLERGYGITLGGAVAIVAHGGSNRAILCRALGLGPERLLALGQDYAALSVLEQAGSRWTLRMLNHREPAPTG